MFTCVLACFASTFSSVCVPLFIMLPSSLRWGLSCPVAPCTSSPVSGLSTAHPGQRCTPLLISTPGTRIGILHSNWGGAQRNWWVWIMEQKKWHHVFLFFDIVILKWYIDTHDPCENHTMCIIIYLLLLLLWLALVTSCMLLVPFVWFPLHYCSAHVAICGHWATGTVANVVPLTFKGEQNMLVYSCRFQETKPRHTNFNFTDIVYTWSSISGIQILHHRCIWNRFQPNCLNFF